MQRVRQPNKLTVNADRAKALFTAIRDRIQRGEGSHPELKAQVFKAFAKFFTELSEPTAEAKPLMAIGLRDPAQYTELMRAVQADIGAAFADADNLAGSIVSSFNLSAVLAEQLDGTSKRMASKSQDLQHLSETFTESTIVAGDDFADDSRIDKSMALDAPAVELPPNQNAVLLSRESAANVFEDKDVVVRILSKFRIYEGNFYALEGEARPEGERFHFSGPDNSIETDATAPGAPLDLLRRFNSWRADPVLPSMLQTPAGEKNRSEITAGDLLEWVMGAAWDGSPFSSNELDMLVNNYHVDLLFGGDPSSIAPTPRHTEMDKGAPIDERRRSRLKMVDSNPDTFWECEFVIDASEAIGVPDAPTAAATQPQPSNRPRLLELLTRNDGGVAGEQPAPAEGGDTGGTITLGELLDRLSGPAIDRMDLDCSVIIELPGPEKINFINLMPHNFSDTTWLEVLGVSTSLDGANFEPIEGMHENVLTEDANSELTDEEVALTLAPNKFQYTGQGVWTFPTRDAKYIRLDLLQKTPIPAPYDVLVMEMTQTMVSTHVGHRGTDTATTHLSDTRELSYLDTLKILVGDSDNLGLVTDPQSMSNITRPIGGTTGDILRDILDPGRFLHSSSPAASTSHDYSGWNVKDQHTLTKWDRARYAVGIKEVGAWSYRYLTSSGFVSVPFRSPKPISSISLHTDEIIPREFNADIVRSWIRYWLSFNDGQDWMEIAPANEDITSLVDSNDAPQIIHVNSGIPEQERDARAGYVDFDGPINQVRLKAVLSRPGNKVDMTPVLKGYRLRMMLRGGL